jgi:precorrin-8X/cobalt-precorrin-8 methylmutase
MSISPGKEIESESFRIIRSQMGPHGFSELEEAVVVRVVHATADFDFVHSLRFHPYAVSAGIEALQRGCIIITDVRMVQTGISRPLLSLLGGQVVCGINDKSAHERAGREGTTRAVAAMRKLVPKMGGGILAIGNAPTALLEVLRLVREDGIRPALVVGVPVGFVSAVESKDDLTNIDVPYIAALGRKGGSPVAVAIVNALLRLAVEE